MIRTADGLATIKVLYRQNDTMSLWGVPYEMRRNCGQSPDDIANHHGWIYLGGPGWWGSIPEPEITAIKEYLSRMPIDAIPSYPNEWTSLRDWRVDNRHHMC